MLIVMPAPVQKVSEILALEKAHPEFPPVQTLAAPRCYIKHYGAKLSTTAYCANIKTKLSTTELN